MTVRDLALLTRHIVAEFPEYFKYYSEREFEYGGIKQPNRNPLLNAGIGAALGLALALSLGSVLKARLLSRELGAPAWLDDDELVVGVD